RGHGTTEYCCRPEREAGARGCPRLPCRARYPTAQYQEADFGVRSDDHGLAPVQPDEQAPSLHSRGRSDAGDRPGRECCRPRNLPIRTQLLGLDWARSQTALKFGSISKQGDRYLRSLFVAGALAVIRYAKIHGTQHRPWLTALLGRRPTKVAAIALANKIARMAWAMMAKGERYKEPIALAR